MANPRGTPTNFPVGSGNPRGRPRALLDLRRRIREWGTDLALVLRRIALDDAEAARDRISACSLLLSYGYGRAPARYDDLPAASLPGDGTPSPGAVATLGYRALMAAAAGLQAKAATGELSAHDVKLLTDITTACASVELGAQRSFGATFPLTPVTVSLSEPEESP